MPVSTPAKLLTLARDLQRRKARERTGLFVTEGVRAVEELLQSPLAVQGAIVSPALADAPRGQALRQSLAQRGVTLLEASEREFASGAQTDTPQGVLAIAEIPVRPLAAIRLTAAARILVLDAVQDPGNAGAMLRTAAALGASATIAMPGTVDLWNGKVVRSAMGALFHHIVVSADWSELDSLLAAHQAPLWAADAAGEPLGSVTPPARLALVVGNEGGGITAEANARAARHVAIPIAREVDSLNAAVAAGILLWALRS